MGTMTVRENLEFSAALRLPKDFTKKDREKRVNSIIQDLGLFRCADTRVSLFIYEQVQNVSKWASILTLVSALKKYFTPSKILVGDVNFIRRSLLHLILFTLLLIILSIGWNGWNPRCFRRGKTTDEYRNGIDNITGILISWRTDNWFRCVNS